MANQTRVTETIKKRNSCRTYSQTPIDKDQEASLKTFLSENKTGPFGASSRFRLITGTAEDQNDLKDLGSYGVIKNVAGFIIGAVKDGPNNLEDFGYAMEKNILFATRMGLGTCWLGGTFTKSTFADKIGLRSDESIPAVAATGHIAPQKSLLEKTMRWGAGADKRKPWQTLFFKNTFDQPLSPGESGEWNTPLEMVRLGPSASNQQPWRIVKHADKNTFHFYLQRTKRYQTRNRILFGMADLQRVDMGIAMCHFEMTAAGLGLAGKWRFEEPDIGHLPEQTGYVASWAAAV
ncbi:MAG: nitroreductase family protein [Desulfosalsimonadaceae bacterium]